MNDKKIKSARITAMPKSLFDEMPMIFVTFEDGTEEFLFSYYPDEISFTAKELEGLTVAEAKNLKFCKDYAYMRS